MTPLLFLLLATPCTTVDLAAHRPVQLLTGHGEAAHGEAAHVEAAHVEAAHVDPGMVTRGERAVEGASWDGALAVTLPPDGRLSIDLGATQMIRHLVVQADNDDLYWVDGSDDGVRWQRLWIAPPSPAGTGVRTRSVTLAAAAPARYLALGGSGGDQRYAVASVSAFCAQPPIWPPALTQPAHPAPFTTGDERMAAIKGLVAALATLVLGLELLLRALGRADWLKRGREALLAALGIVSFACFFNMGNFHFPRFTHIWEHYHYYVGAKYFRELGYTRLYDCTSVAEAELGFRDDVAERPVRDLTTNLLRDNSAVLADPSLCKSHFSPARWEKFRADIAWFRSQFPLQFWRDSQTDHGFNGTPAWIVTGSLLANLAPASWTQIELLGALDPLLLLAMWIAVRWAFGPETLAIALVYWGTNLPARWYWNGGSYLRMDWLAATVIAFCLLRRGRAVGSGFSLGCATLLRIFPGFILLGLVFKVAAQSIARRRLTLEPAQRRFAGGFLLAFAIAVPLSVVVAGGGPLTAWSAFAHNASKHLATPLTNNMGLKTVVAYRIATRAEHLRDFEQDDPFMPWKAARLAAFAQRRVLYLLLAAGLLALLALAVAREEDWVALVLGVAAIPILTELTCYYYSVLLAFGLLWQRRPIACVLLSLLASLGCSTLFLLPWEDDREFVLSLATLVYIALLLLSIRWRISTRRNATTNTISAIQ